MYIPNAIIRSHSKILIIENNKIIGKGQWCSSYNDVTSLRILEGEALTRIEKIAGNYKFEAKYINPRFCDIDGSYQPRENGWEELNQAFMNTYAVSEFEFNYRMVPDFFKNVEGYGSAFNIEDNNC